MSTPKSVIGYQKTQGLPIPVRRALTKLGEDLSAARRRRRISMDVMAERAFIARKTLARVERGDPTVSMGIYASVLFVLGMVDRLAGLVIDEHEQTASLELARSVIASFGISNTSAKQIVREVARPVAAWRTYGTAVGLTKRQLDRMASAFEHDDLQQALGR